MAKYDFFVEYKANQRYLFANTIDEFKSFLKLKGGLIHNKNSELKRHKDFIKNKKYKYSIGDIQKIKKISGIYENPQNLQNYINKLPKHSFAIWVKCKLEAPYFSKDDNEFYIIQNPIIKESNFKVPMVRGSSWKGALASAFKVLIKEENNNKREKIDSFLRIFGAGSESIKAIESYIFDNNKNLKKVKEGLLKFILFELGLKVDSNLIKEINSVENKDGIINIIKNKLSKKLENIQQNFPAKLLTHKGRAIFYPTYFDRLSLEIINPHDRRKRAGTNPIHYEVVPKGGEGIFQLIYIPFDGILQKDDEIKNEAKQDLEFLKECIKKAFKNGIGAKTKLGWGRADIKDEDIQVFWSER